MELKELEDLVDTVYGIVGKRYLDNFKYIIGGCHCYPATEWYGDIYLTFKSLISDDVINDKYIKNKCSVSFSIFKVVRLASCGLYTIIKSIIFTLIH